MDELGKRVPEGVIPARRDIITAVPGATGGSSVVDSQGPDFLRRFTSPVKDFFTDSKNRSSLFLWEKSLYFFL